MTGITDPDRAVDVPPEGPPRATFLRRYGRFLFRMAFAAAVASAMWYLVWATIGKPATGLQSLFIPASIVLVCGLFILRNERHWARHARRLIELLPELRSGDAPVEELNRIHGGFAPLVPLLQELVRDLRLHRNEMAQLNEEIRHRVAGRTNALERQIGSLKQQATRDGLTGLFNRRMFDELLPRMIERCTTGKLDLSLLMIDVDNFKILNDTLGHAAGDELLKGIAQLIRSGIRSPDAPFRLGGDEFVVILPHLGPDEAAEVAQRLVQMVDALAKPISVPAPPRLSIGVASISQLPAKTAIELVHLADKRLYAVKATRHRPARKDKLRASA